MHPPPFLLSDYSWAAVDYLLRKKNLNQFCSYSNIRPPSPGTRLYGVNSYVEKRKIMINVQQQQQQQQFQQYQARPNSAKRNIHPPQLVTRTFDVSSYDLSQMGKSGEMDRAMRQM
ncbi:MAG: hypothetical protein EZS28_047589, partial [Streblomastix strix]